MISFLTGLVLFGAFLWWAGEGDRALARYDREIAAGRCRDCAFNDLAVAIELGNWPCREHGTVEPPPAWTPPPWGPW